MRHDETRLRRLELERTRWNNQLEHNREIALQTVRNIILGMAEKHPISQLSQYDVGLRSGLYTPQDFTGTRVPCS